MTTPDADGWITHDGGPCPVAPGRLVMVNGGTDLGVCVGAQPGYGQYQSEPHGSCTEYLRADIAAAREAELRAEVERLTEEGASLAMFQCVPGYGDEYGNSRCAIQDDNARLRGLLDEARKGLVEAADELDSYYRAEWGLDHPIHQRNLKFAMDGNCARATLAKIGEQ